MTNSFCPEDGGLLCPDCSPTRPLARPVPVNTLKVLRFLQGSDYNAASRLKIDPALSRQLRELLRDYTDYLLEREVKSAAWLDSLRGASG